jgi:hypothetical protein
VAAVVAPTMVMLDAPLLSVIPAPATRDTLEELPFREKFVPVGKFFAERVPKLL